MTHGDRGKGDAAKDTIPIRYSASSARRSAVTTERPPGRSVNSMQACSDSVWRRGHLGGDPVGSVKRPRRDTPRSGCLPSSPALGHPFLGLGGGRCASSPCHQRGGRRWRRCMPRWRPAMAWVLAHRLGIGHLPSRGSSAAAAAACESTACWAGRQRGQVAAAATKIAFFVRVKPIGVKILGRNPRIAAVDAGLPPLVTIDVDHAGGEGLRHLGLPAPGSASRRTSTAKRLVMRVEGAHAWCRFSVSTLSAPGRVGVQAGGRPRHLNTAASAPAG